MVYCLFCSSISLACLNFGFIFQVRPDGLEKPAEDLFFGIINQCIEMLVSDKFGMDKWHAVKEKAGLTDVDDGDFLDSHQYDQDITYQLVGAIVEILDITAEQALEATGDFFVSEYLPRKGYIPLVRSQAPTLRGLFAALNRMHSHLNSTHLPGLAPPCFKTQIWSEDSENMFLVHYWSYRPGLTPLVRGTIIGAARSLFQMKAEVEVVESTSNKGLAYTVFQVKTQDMEKKRSTTSEAQISSEQTDGGENELKVHRQIAGGRKKTEISDLRSLVHILTDSVQSLKSVEEVTHFQSSFTSDELCVLLETKDVQAKSALEALFIEPFVSRAYRLPISAVVEPFNVVEYPSLAMGRYVMHRCGPLSCT